MARSLAGAWLDVVQANWSTAFKLGETALAANTVIGSRLGTIGDAMRDPLSGDYAELSGMVTEKAAAFAQAGMAVVRDTQTIQVEMAAALAQMGALWAQGSAPGVRDVRAFSARSTRIARRVAGAADNALAPVHARASANARRLRKG